MYHSITLGSKNTWDSWHLIPKSRPLVNPPRPKTNYVDIPGGNGQIDLTENLTGKPTYENRTGSWTFIAENGFKPWSELYSEIMAHLHGRAMRATLEDDPSYFYEGRFSVSGWDSGANYSTITIDYNLNPYKWSAHSSTEDWIWDTFNFETGVIKQYSNLSLEEGPVTVDITGREIPAIPVFITSAPGVTMTYGGKTYALSIGHNVFDDIVVNEGTYEFTFQGSGTITLQCRGGVL